MEMPSTSSKSLWPFLIMLGIVVFGVFLANKLATQTLEAYDENGNLIGTGEIKTSFKSKKS